MLLSQIKKHGFTQYCKRVIHDDVGGSFIMWKLLSGIEWLFHSVFFINIERLLFPLNLNSRSIRDNKIFENVIETYKPQLHWNYGFDSTLLMQSGVGDIDTIIVSKH